MNRIDLFHKTFFGLNIGAVLTGFGRGDLSDTSLNVVLICLLMLALRFKFWADDEAYFEDVTKGKLEEGKWFYVGFALGTISWTIWLFAGFFLKEIELASLLMVAVLAPSTFWIVATMVRTGGYHEQLPWLIFNLLYGVGFFLCALATTSWHPYSQNSKMFITVVLVLLIVLFVVDFVVTRIREGKRRNVTS